MSDKTFVDTNVLIYAHDVDANKSRRWPRAFSKSFGAIVLGFSACRCFRSFT